MSSDPPDSRDADAGSHGDGGGEGDGAEDRSLTEAEVERIARAVVREELAADDGAAHGPRISPFWPLLAGVLAGAFLFLPLSAGTVGWLLDAGVPPRAVAALGLLVTATLVAYGWRLPPFR